MSHKSQAVLGCLALLLAALSGYAVWRFFDRLTLTTTLPVPNQAIPAGAWIEAGMLTERVVPRALAAEPVYTRAADLVGRVAQVPLYPGLVVYQAYAVPPAQYRLVADPTLTVISLPVDPARAVGGQLQPGHQIDLWQVPLARAGAAGEAPRLTPTLVLSAVQVVDVRGASGQAVARQPQAVPGQAAGQSAPAGAALPLHILTVAVPVSQTQPLLSLIAAEHSQQAALWVALAPLVRPAGPAAALPPSTPPPPGASLAPPAALPGMPRLVVRQVLGTAGGGSAVYERPGGPQVGELPAGALVIVLTGPQPDAGGELWYHVTQHGSQAVSGWMRGPALSAEEP